MHRGEQVVPYHQNGYIYQAMQDGATITEWGAANYKDATTKGFTTSGHVTFVHLLSGGSGYTSPPLITFSGNGGATAQAVIHKGSVVRVEVINCGSGYTSPPVATISGGGGNGAAIRRVDISWFPHSDQMDWQLVRPALTRMWFSDMDIEPYLTVRPSNDSYISEVDPVFRVESISGMTSATEPAWTGAHKDGAIEWGIQWTYLEAHPWSYFKGRKPRGWEYPGVRYSGDLVAADGHVFQVRRFADTSIHLIQPSWSEAPADGADFMDSNGITWACVGLDGSNSPIWSPNSLFRLGTLIRPTSPLLGDGRLLFSANSVSIRTGSVQPNWSSSDTLIEQVHNGSITWERVGVDAADVDFRATRRVILRDGFRAEVGSRFHAYIKPVIDEDDPKSWVERFQYASISDLDTVWVRENRSIHDRTAHSKPEQVELVENAGGQMLRLHADYDPITVVIDSIPYGHPAQVSQVHTKRRFDRFGSFEARCKTPTSQGTFTSFWLHSHCAENCKPTLHDASFDEIDIFERADWYAGTWQGHHCDGYTLQTVYNYSHNPMTTRIASGSDVYSGVDLSADFHTYTFEWLPGAMRWLIDGRVVKRLPDKNGFDYPRHATDRQVQVLLHNHSTPKCDTTYHSAFDIEYVKVSPFRSFDGVDKEKIITGSASINFLVKPNPTSSGTIEIELISDVTLNNLEVKLYDVLGNEIDFNFRAPTGKNWRVKYDFPSSLANGIYYLHLAAETSQGTISATRQVILQR